MRTKHDVDNSQDILDSRDIIARIKELEDEREAIAEEWSNRAEFPDTTRYNPDLLTLAEWDATDEWIELQDLKDLQSEAEGYADDWHHGCALIRDSYFEEYARQTAEDMGALENCDKWPATCIDWTKAAEELQQDYTSVDFGGITYWVR